MNEQQEDKYLFEIIEMFKVDGNTEPFFKKKFKLENFLIQIYFCFAKLNKIIIFKEKATF